jgi:tyrosyl-tRNA synthetase
MDKIDFLLTRGVHCIYPNREVLEKVLRSGKKLRLYQGFDPTGVQFHIGHAVGLRKLRQWQDLGHHVIFLIGDGTGQAGDPSGKTRSREKFLTNEELRKNAKDYVMQAKRIVRFDGDNPAEILYNSDWLNKLMLVDILNIAGHFSWQQLAERDLYQERIKSGQELNFREAMYPLLQGYDSVAMNVDLEIGGVDQTFNMLAGRQLVAQMQKREKFVMTVPLLTDNKGTKIGKTEGNVIGLTDPPCEFFGKIMSLGDGAIIPCLTLLTDSSEETIKDMEKKMKSGGNPMIYKKMLAYELTKQFNDERSAKKAQEEFETRFQKGKLQDADLTEKPIFLFDKESVLIDDLVTLGLAVSKSEARRFIEQKAVRINDELASDPKQHIEKKPGDIFKVGRKAVRIIS